uniref:ARAD1B12298p n=1 Tax=Blastobotrys adeninivorans TaxID=409370 RepID=A0A060T6H9_BLAAD
MNLDQLPTEVLDIITDILIDYEGPEFVGWVQSFGSTCSRIHKVVSAKIFSKLTIVPRDRFKLGPDLKCITFDRWWYTDATVGEGEISPVDAYVRHVDWDVPSFLPAELADVDPDKVQAHMDKVIDMHLAFFDRIVKQYPLATTLDMEVTLEPPYDSRHLGKLLRRLGQTMPSYMKPSIQLKLPLRYERLEWLSLREGDVREYIEYLETRPSELPDHEVAFVDHRQYLSPALEYIQDLWIVENPRPPIFQLEPWLEDEREGWFPIKQLEYMLPQGLGASLRIVTISTAIVASPTQLLRFVQSATNLESLWMQVKYRPDPLDLAKGEQPDVLPLPITYPDPSTASLPSSLRALHLEEDGATILNGHLKLDNLETVAYVFAAPSPSNDHYSRVSQFLSKSPAGTVGLSLKSYSDLSRFNWLNTSVLPRFAISINHQYFTYNPSTSPHVLMSDLLYDEQANMVRQFAHSLGLTVQIEPENEDWHMIFH